MAKFVSRQMNFRIFLRMCDSGGQWADFGDRGECEVKDPEDAEKLRNAPNFGKDFYEVGREKKKEEAKVKVSDEDIISVIEEAPDGITLPQMGKALGVSHYLSIAARTNTLVEQKKLRKEDNRYFPIKEVAKVA